jgi:hypothetical protein
MNSKRTRNTDGLKQKFPAEYGTWSGMKARCINPNRPGFLNYGGRGIKVCGRWRDSFRNFVDDIGPRPSAAHSLDRLDVNGNYEPGNVRWATTKEQGENRRPRTVLELNGERATTPEWARRRGIPPSIISMRLLKGWSVADAINRPLTKKARKTIPTEQLLARSFPVLHAPYRLPAHAFTLWTYQVALHGEILPLLRLTVPGPFWFKYAGEPGGMIRLEAA